MDINDLDAKIAELEVQFREFKLAWRLTQEGQTHGCTNGCTGDCPDPTGNCTYGCTNGCTNGCTDAGCADAFRIRRYEHGSRKH